MTTTILLVCVLQLYFSHPSTFSLSNDFTWIDASFLKNVNKTPYSMNDFPRWLSSFAKHGVECCWDHNGRSSGGGGGGAVVCGSCPLLSCCCEVGTLFSLLHEGPEKIRENLENHVLNPNPWWVRVKSKVFKLEDTFPLGLEFKNSILKKSIFISWAANKKTKPIRPQSKPFHPSSLPNTSTP